MSVVWWVAGVDRCGVRGDRVGMTSMTVPHGFEQLRRRRLGTFGRRALDDSDAAAACDRSASALLQGGQAGWCDEPSCPRRCHRLLRRIGRRGNRHRWPGSRQATRCGGIGGADDRAGVRSRHASDDDLRWRSPRPPDRRARPPRRAAAGDRPTATADRYDHEPTGDRTTDRRPSRPRRPHHRW